MADKKMTRYLEIQMDELKAAIGVDAEEQDSAPNNNKAKNNKAKNADVAKLYEDAAEYEEELQCFEEELEIINASELKDMAGALTQKLPDEERNYAKELKAILIAGWTHLVEVEKIHPIEQLELIKETEFCDVIEKLNTEYPDFDGDFEKSVRGILVKRWETLIAIKKEHIEEEMEEIYIAGLKPSFVKRIYKQFHGIS
ncbi:hypothetical protein HUE87_03725 [Candidatus Sulfurimonas marisnigri]|uniref:Uncharacterized protein n=1 Tax=Candidatus Sulfurimonas marisnigri TaxID=2740405 RepID=A0A7S7M1M3_9BACT|nr:hypothetical protein [Candidatus Sulfurimonas marisnigri]QOY55358.1 hypothetical protein HUE87_03725 [Candidatus Sulfurimonas marisnigri]